MNSRTMMIGAALICLASAQGNLRAAETVSVKMNSYTNVYKGLIKEQEFEGQEWPFKPGKRMVKMYVREPANGVNANTGFMLLLHNWGGIDPIGDLNGDSVIDGGDLILLIGGWNTCPW